jgi:hypothetical protein
MLEITIDISQIAGAADAFGRFPEKMKAALRTANVESQRELLKEAKDRVHVVTGTLRRSITAPAPEELPDGWSGRVGPGVVYAAMEEFGFTGPQAVRAHIRSSCFGRATRPFTVPAHMRNIVRREHPYLRPAVVAARDRILEIHRKAVDRVLADIGSSSRAGGGGEE